MLKSKRKQLILEKVTKDKFVSLEYLVKALDTSESTVRRDLDELESERKLRRVHGGAESLHFLQEEESNQEKSIKNIQEKTRIAQKAASLIQEYDVIFIDAGTTNELLVNELHDPSVTVVTNSIHHATKLVERNIPTVIIGGVVKRSTDASIGGVALNQIGQLNFDKAFIGMNGIDDGFFTTPDMEEGAVKRAILENTKRTYVLADASKLGQTSFAKVAPISRARLITNQTESEVIQKIKEKTEVIEV
ncbi:transcriptional regulator, DeoR family [Streptococcus cristatus ATCC 51100]|uniref:Transcriptional regulator, DeoR family n=1 Tax=Streptococcus cristatus ATCC 51100 TaxID=889201 RepID=A0AAV3EBY3_STRCR|nr:DeoR/GlpR family DNA-binding transcription regulator [Streptococcus cristatus]EFX53287.1 transcriptional regulator, DeoR family [Streptococcus cristatus ATCC 51100]EGU66177.1 transcriptional regulator, DeoR family [Streptococcus cristatus ATCC 51100]KJQ57175.1 lactose PTS system repressor [Streptococcus cristatus]SQG32154.1 fructose operon transcriptional repressor [Streptococcus cristatus ATCC 51100]